MSTEAQEALADLLRDIARALDPEHPELVRVGPVDFGPAPLHPTFTSARSEQFDDSERSAP